jgi:hypothetical protein
LPDVESTDRPRLGRELLIAWVHLAVLWSFAFAKPLFDVVADSPDFFVARGNTGGDIVIFAIAMIVIPPTLLVLVEAALYRVPAVRSVVHLVLVGVLFAAFAVQVLDDLLGGSAAVLIVLALLLGAAVAFAYRRVDAVPAVLTVLGPLPLVFLLLFLFGSDVSKLVLPEDDAQAAGAHVRSSVPVVMLVFDEFDANMLMNGRHRIDPTRYPNLAALARDSTWYPNATTVNSQTTLAVPALLSGRRPTPDLLPIPADYPDNLFTLLGDSHDVHATETATQICPERLCGSREREPIVDRLRSLAKDLGIVSAHLVAPERMESDLPAVDQTFGNFGGGGRDEARPTQPDVPLSALSNRPAQFAALFNKMKRQKGRPGLFFLHAALPHIPWQYLPGGQQYVNAGPDFPGLDREKWSTNPFTWRLGLQRHLLQAAYADRMVGCLTARLREDGIYDRALVVITADHGVSFRPGEPRRAPVPANFSDIASMPLLIKYPDRPGGRVDDSFVRTIDVVPTIASALGVKLPWEAQGRSIAQGGPADGEVSVRVGGGDVVSRMSFSGFVRRHDAGLRRMLSLYAAGAGTGELYANGPNADLLGQAAGRIPAVASTGTRLELDSTNVFAPFRPGARLVPSFISGVIGGGVRPGESLAVAVDGKIRGLSESFSSQDGVRMAAIVPASSFEAGRNTVAVYAVRGQGDARRLAPLAIQRPESYRLAGDTLTGGGRTYELEKGRIKGFVDDGIGDDQGARLSGWAVDSQGPGPAERVLAFLNDDLIGQARPSRDRPDIATNLKTDAVLRSGFELRLAIPASELGDVRVFAISKNAATELNRFSG